MPRLADKQNSLPRRKSPRFNEITPIRTAKCDKVITPINRARPLKENLSTTKVNTPNTKVNKNNKFINKSLVSRMKPTDVKPAENVPPDPPSTGDGNTLSEDKKFEAIFEKFVAKVDEDRKLVIAEMQNVMVTKLKDEIAASVNQSLQESLASMKNQLYVELKNKFSGELNEIRNDIDELKLQNDGNTIDDNKIMEIANRMDNLENPVKSEWFNEMEERIKRKKTSLFLIFLRVMLLMAFLERNVISRQLLISSRRSH